MRACVRACVRACERACVRACARYRVESDFVWNIVLAWETLNRHSLLVSIDMFRLD